MKTKKIKIFVVACFTFLTLSIIGLCLWTLHLNSQIQQRLAKGWFLPPVEIYTAATTLRPGMTFPEEQLVRSLQNFDFRERQPGQQLREGDWVRIPRLSCQDFSENQISEDTYSCVIFHPKTSRGGPLDFEGLVIVGFTFEGVVKDLLSGQDFSPLDQVQLEPVLFAQYYGEQPILRRLIQVGQTPLMCLQAITAIEDSQFLEHRGVSITGTLRAVWRNISQARFAEGGSTITQQLVKNYFLTGEKTIKRKLTEQLMAVILELQIDKDTILENYLNVIYMGANGPFQVRGFGAASKHYFGEKLEDLDLPQCALLAALVNSPGRYNPFQHPERAKERRNLVLAKMEELGMLDAQTAERARQTALPEKKPKLLSEPAPYFIQALNRKLNDLNIERDQGLRIFTTMNVKAQEAAQSLVLSELERLEQWYRSLSENKKEGKDLQAALLSVDVKTGNVLALVGGRTFSNTQYNRILDARRQVGSVMKPFVYLTALETTRENGEFYSPLTTIADERFNHRYEGQEWSPKNYDGTYRGTVPLFYALKNSLNAATARLGLDIGLNAIIDTARRFGLESSMKALPSLTLGAFELRPWEVARAYLGFARMGSLTSLKLVESVESIDGEVLYLPDSASETVAAPENVAVLVSMMKQTLQTGTAKYSQKLGFTRPAAGKTGTTSDTKDAWFVGFTPQVLTLTWVGYDDNTESGLTGATGALPLWVALMKEVASLYPETDFSWPAGTYPLKLDLEDLYTMLPSSDPPEQEVELLLRSSDETFDH